MFQIVFIIEKASGKFSYEFEKFIKSRKCINMNFCHHFYQFRHHDLFRIPSKFKRHRFRFRVCTIWVLDTIKSIAGKRSKKRSISLSVCNHFVLFCSRHCFHVVVIVYVIQNNDVSLFLVTSFVRNMFATLVLFRSGAKNEIQPSQLSDG